MKKLILLFILIVILWEFGVIDTILNKYYEYKYGQNTSDTIEFQEDTSIMVDTSDSDVNMPTIKIKQYISNKEKLDRISIPHIKPMHKRTQSKQKYSCDGRIWCSQMHSCEEAIFFINNCPGTKMDGNHDGVPCERQWCGH